MCLDSLGLCSKGISEEAQMFLDNSVHGNRLKVEEENKKMLKSYEELEKITQKTTMTSKKKSMNNIT